MSLSDAPSAPPPAPEAPARRRRVSLWMVLLIAALATGLRAGYVLTLDSRLRFPDEEEYLNISENLASGKGFVISMDPQTLQPYRFPLEIQRTPMYPIMLALARKARLDITGVRLVQAVLGGLTAVMIYLLGAKLVGERPGRIAGLLAAICPFFIYFTGLVLSETLFILFFVTCWYYVVRAWKDAADGGNATQVTASCLVAGLLAAASVLTRASALPVFLAVPVVWLIVGPRRVFGFSAALLMLLALSVGMTPWVWRNYKRSSTDLEKGRLVISTLSVGESLYEAVGPFATGGPNKENTVWPDETGLTPGDEYARDRLLFRKSLAYMKNDPGRTLRLAWIKFLRTWNVIPNYEKARTPIHVAVSLASYVPVLLAAAAGLLVNLRRPRVLAWTLLPVVIFTLIHMVFVGSVRYRLPMEPFVMVLSGAGLWRLFCKVFKRPGETVEEN